MVDIADQHRLGPTHGSRSVDRASTREQTHIRTAVSFTDAAAGAQSRRIPKEHTFR
ncbi:hypothetical protein [Nucisporomicrobium flavum]|jgi:hypothetical protein|uniref:hypothetical protein n=1 Tax=Nucisporomicrobium flavum TaxID=2785915 RepID=UPI0018F59445|nr:hypothetical protein [Nucisporomicrobium flavum]